MRIKILLVEDSNIGSSDAEMLRERGFLVYTCKQDVISEMIDEIKPGVVFLNPENSDTSAVYNNLLENVKFAAYPVIYTLSEDDVYIVNRRRDFGKQKRTIISDNIIDSIKTALLDFETNNVPHVHAHSKNIPVSYYAHRA